MASGYCTGHSRQSAFPSLQKVPLDKASLEAKLRLCEVLPVASLIPSCYYRVSLLSPAPGVGVPACLSHGPGRVGHPPEPEEDSVKLAANQHLQDVPNIQFQEMTMFTDHPLASHLLLLHLICPKLIPILQGC